MANLFRRKKIQLNPYNSVWDQKTSSWQPAPVGTVNPTPGPGPQLTSENGGTNPASSPAPSAANSYSDVSSTQNLAPGGSTYSTQNDFQTAQQTGASGQANHDPYAAPSAASSPAPSLVSEHGAGMESPALIVGTNMPDGHLTSATSKAPELVSEHGGGMASTSVNIPVTVDPGPSHAMVTADMKTESTAPTIPTGSVGSVAAGSVPSAAPVSNTVNSYDVGGSIVNPPITLPPSTANDTPATGLGSLNPSGVADTATSNAHTPGMHGSLE